MPLRAPNGLERREMKRKARMRLVNEADEMAGGIQKTSRSGLPALWVLPTGYGLWEVWSGNQDTPAVESAIGPMDLPVRWPPLDALHAHKLRIINMMASSLQAILTLPNVSLRQ
jgi:hypothetical protein